MREEHYKMGFNLFENGTHRLGDVVKDKDGIDRTITEITTFFKTGHDVYFYTEDNELHVLCKKTRRASMGKNFSKNNMGQRKERDFYETPYSLTRELLKREKLFGTILEPACGEGAITKVLSEFGYNFDKSDIENNFLKQSKHYDTIITNPPFTIANEFILKASELSSVFYFLLPLNYLHGKKRYNEIFKNNKLNLEKVFIMTRTPMLGNELREDGKFKTGMQLYAWYKFNKNFIGNPTIEWIELDKYVLKKEDNV